MAKRLGWSRGLPNQAIPIATMAVYTWLRHHHSFSGAVQHALRLGGQTSCLAALVGGLAAIHLSTDSIPETWKQRLIQWPYNRRWFDRLTTRLTDWPHGSEDLHSAPAMRIKPLRFFIRSVVLNTAFTLQRAMRLPFQLFSWIARD
mgnify:CR=1 FL=1